MTHPRSRHRAADRGSGTVWMIALMALVWLVAMVAMTAGGARAARHRAHAAADLAALAAASHAGDGPARACRVAATIARATRGRLTECVLRGPVAGVKVVAVFHVPGFGPLHATAAARAGPVPWQLTQLQRSGTEHGERRDERGGATPSRVDRSRSAR